MLSNRKSLAVKIGSVLMSVALLSASSIQVLPMTVTAGSSATAPPLVFGTSGYGLGSGQGASGLGIYDTTHGLDFDITNGKIYIAVSDGTAGTIQTGNFPLRFSPNSAEAMRIQTNGNVLISPGTLQPSGGIVQVTTTVPYTVWATYPSSIGVTTQVTYANGRFQYSQLWIGANSTLTGACLLNGGTIGTNKVIYVLWNQAGTVLANTATAGVTTANASALQCIAFTGTVAVQGPQAYYIGVQANGTTDNFTAYSNNGAPLNYATGQQAGVFGTVAAISSPSASYNAVQGPVMPVY